MLCCCRQQQVDINADAPPKPSGDSDKEKVFTEAVTAHPSPAATPVTHQPAVNDVRSAAASPTAVNPEVPSPEPQEKRPVVEENIIQAAVKSVEAAARSQQPAVQSVDSTPTPKPNVSIINVTSSQVQEKALSTVASTTAAAADTAVLSQIDSLTQAIEEKAAAGQLKGRESCSVFASQLSVLTSQVRAQAGNMSEAALQNAVSRLESVAGRLESLALRSGGSSAGDAGETAMFVTAFDDVLAGSFAKFLSLSSEIGGDVKTQVNLVEQAFKAERQFLVTASKSKEPAAGDLAKVLQPVADKLMAAQNFREDNRRSEFFNHLSAVSESIAALGWVTVSPAPGPYVKEMKDAGMFYGNRVLKDYKDKDQKHVDWVKAWMGTLTELQDYIKQYHTTGVTWNPKGGSATSAAASAPSPPAGGAPPPPPPGPPPPPPPPPPPASDSGAGADSRAALFADLSKGEAVTSGLKKVTDDMKTHKNPALRQGPAPFKAAAPKPVAAPKPKPDAVSKVAAVKPPVFELQNNKWVVEHHDNNKNLVIENTALKQTVYVYKCTNCVVQVKGKINSVIMDSCKKTAIVFEDLVSSLEFVNCQSMQGQVTGKVPTISIDKTDGCMVYLSESSLDAEIVTAKSSEMNILVPVGGGDYSEFALPEQFKTTWNGKSMTTVQMDSM